jgi:hypothetical protein
VLREQQVRRVRKENPEYKVNPEQQVLKVFKVFRVPQVRLELPEQQVRRVRKESPEYKVLKGKPVLLRLLD